MTTSLIYSVNNRALIGPRSGKPEQKVRPLSVKPPVGTVQPTARPKPKPAPACEEKDGGPSKVCSPQAARLAKRYSTLLFTMMFYNVNAVFNANHNFMYLKCMMFSDSRKCIHLYKVVMCI